MAKRPIVGRKQLSLDGEWTLLELSGFGRQYVQVYSFLYALHYGPEPSEDEIPEEYIENVDDQEDRVLHAFRAFPWAGGWSTVDFYESLRNAVPKAHRPQIVSIKYASPGFIELGLVLPTAWAISKLVRHFCGTIKEVNSTYHQIYADTRQRELLRTNVRRAEFELKRDQLVFAENAAEQLAKALDFPEMEQLQKFTANPVVRLKILMSLFRRLKELAKLQNSGQIKF